MPENAELLRADAILVCDTGNSAVGVPTLTTSLRGMANVVVTVEALASAMHSGMFGGAAPDALAALIRMLAIAARRRTATRRSTGSTTPRPGPASTTRPSSSAPTPSVLDGVDADRRRHRSPTCSGPGPRSTVLGIDCPPVVGSAAAIQPRAAARAEPADPARAWTPKPRRTR